MNHLVIERVITLWRKSLFLEPTLLLLFAAGLVVAIVKNNKQGNRIAFLIYFFLGTLLFLAMQIQVIFRNFNVRTYHVVLEFCNTVFELGEYIAFFYFFRDCLQTKSFKSLSRIFLLFLICISVAFSIGLLSPTYETDDFQRHSLIINVIEFLFLSTMCLGYFYELLTTAPKTNLLKRPSFFIVTSVFFYAVASIPFFVLARDIILVGKAVYFIFFDCHFLLLSIVLVSIMRALLRETAITT